MMKKLLERLTSTTTAATHSVDSRTDRFFSKLDWASFWTATLLTFAVYFFTLGPSVGLEDSGELATAGAHLGVPHPPGYPFWTLCSWIFCKLFFWVSYMGHPTPAWAISCFSAAASLFSLSLFAFSYSARPSSSSASASANSARASLRISS